MPTYDPLEWNDGGAIQHNNNCYDYALDWKSGQFSQPGATHGHILAQPYGCDAVAEGATLDGLTECEDEEDCDEGCWKVALVTDPDFGYHWYRQDGDGTWSHKPGQTEATDVDSSENTIDDPSEADYSPYDNFCGFFCVCPDDLKFANVMPGTGESRVSVTLKELPRLVTTSMEVEVPPGRVTISHQADDTSSARQSGGRPMLAVHALIFSGPRDPSWSLTDEQRKFVQDRLQGLTPSELFPGPRLGYQGFLIDNPGGLPEFPRRVRVWRGAIAAFNDHGERQVYEDKYGLEQWLLGIAMTQPFADVLNRAVKRTPREP